MTRLSIRVDFQPSGSALGPGMARLLELVGEKGSIRAAAAEMGMSYRKAWLLLQDIQNTFHGAVISAATGGAAGGGTKLTALGNQLIALYRRIERHAETAAARDLAELAVLVRDNAPRRRGRTKGKA